MKGLCADTDGSDWREGGRKVQRDVGASDGGRGGKLEGKRGSSPIRQDRSARGCRAEEK